MMATIRNRIHCLNCCRCLDKKGLGCQASSIVDAALTFKLTNTSLHFLFSCNPIPIPTHSCNNFDSFPFFKSESLFLNLVLKPSSQPSLQPHNHNRILRTLPRLNRSNALPRCLHFRATTGKQVATPSSILSTCHSSHPPSVPWPKLPVSLPSGC